MRETPPEIDELCRQVELPVSIKNSGEGNLPDRLFPLAHLGRRPSLVAFSCPSRVITTACSTMNPQTWFGLSLKLIRTSFTRS
jgi:hypothetical protein